MRKTPRAFPVPGRAIVLVATIAVLCGPRASWPHPVSAADGSGNKSCRYVVQLQTSVTARQRFLVALDAGREKGWRAADKTHARTAPASGTDNEGWAGYVAWSGAGNAAAVGGGGLDPFSVQCLGCHDGKGASDVAVVLRNAPWQRTSRVTSFSMDHPLGMEYRRYAASGSGFKHLPDGSRLTMVNGRVGCLTCHDPLNPQRGHLAVSDQRSALCLTCHDR